MDIDLLADAILAECRSNRVELWSIIWEVRAALNDGMNPLPSEDRSKPSDVRDGAIKIVHKLLQSGEVQAGYYRPDGSGIDVWDVSPGDVISRISTEWDRIGREPDIGEVAIFGKLA